MASQLPSDSRLRPTSSPNHATELLVSVRSLVEAEAAACLDVDIIDFKEPSRGALAPVNVEVWGEAADRFPHRSLSAALGEQGTALRLAARVPETFRFAKVGPSHVPTVGHLVRLWDRLELPGTIELVPVAYADHLGADCPDVTTILEAVIEENRKRLLIDTFLKDGRGLRDHFTDEILSTLLTRAKRAGVWIALAGSLCLDQVLDLRAKQLTPNCWGVRGDVCNRVVEAGSAMSGRREGAIDPVRVELWANEAHRSPILESSPYPLNLD